MSAEPAVENQPLIGAPIANPFPADASKAQDAGCDPAGKCCLCLPIGCGLKTYAVLHILGSVGYMGLAGLLTEVDATAGGIMFVAILPMIIGAYLFIRFLAASESKTHRHNMIYAVWLAFFTVVISQFITYVAENSTGSLNTKMVKAAAAVDPKAVTKNAVHPTNVQSNTIPRTHAGIAGVLTNIGINLLWSYYIWKKIEVYSEDAKEE